MSPEALNTALAVRDFLLINVHVPDEGEIPGTDAHVAYTDIPALLALVGDDLRQEVVVYCKTSAMALIAGQALVDLGYCAVRYLDGGMNAWETAGYPLTD
jgi:rhodanese-related sulfurtransferase